jgi:hypothetical protein
MGFTDLGVQRVFAHTMTANAASRHVMENCGLTLVHSIPYEGPDADVIDGAEQREVEYALTKPEWEPIQTAERNSLTAWRGTGRGLPGRVWLRPGARARSRSRRLRLLSGVPTRRGCVRVLRPA